MIEVARAIEGISINGKEFLLDENGSTMKFENIKKALEFLKSKGYEKLTDYELEGMFFFEDSEDSSN